MGRFWDEGSRERFLDVKLGIQFDLARAHLLTCFAQSIFVQLSHKLCEIVLDCVTIGYLLL